MAMLGLLSCIVVGQLVIPLLQSNKANLSAMEEFTDDIIHECNPRKGWRVLFSKLEGPLNPTKLKVAFLGGSITGKDDCWRPQTMDMFRRLYPHIVWEEINASVGGTGSNFGAFRLRGEVIVHKPDLIFVEFAVNDAAVSQTVE